MKNLLNKIWCVVGVVIWYFLARGAVDVLNGSSTVNTAIVLVSDIAYTCILIAFIRKTIKETLNSYKK